MNRPNRTIKKGLIMLPSFLIMALIAMNSSYVKAEEQPGADPPPKLYYGCIDRVGSNEIVIDDRLRLLAPEASLPSNLKEKDCISFELDTKNRITKATISKDLERSRLQSGKGEGSNADMHRSDKKKGGIRLENGVWKN